MDKYDYETLKECLSHKDWVGSQDTILLVGHTLNGEGVFRNSDIVLDYFEKPWHWEIEMRDLIIEYELERVSRDMECLTLDQADEAILWLDEFCGFDYKTIQNLIETLDERCYAPCGVK